jgi:hypothetical protein
MAKIRGIVYLGGSQNPKLNQPGNYFNLDLSKKGLKLFYSPTGFTSLSRRREFISWENIVGVETAHKVSEDTTFDRLLGRKNIDSAVNIRYKRLDGKIATLELQSRFAEKIKKKIDKRLSKIHSR